MSLVTDAAALAQDLVEPLGRRWLHVQSVAARAEEVSTVVDEEDRPVLLAAAWLHDIGYAPTIGHSRFHPLDGGRYLRAEGWPARIVNLVVHHSGACFETAERGLSAELEVFPFEDTPVMDALVTADLTTGPSGERLTYDERIAEILERYSADDPVHRTWIKAAPILKECVVRTEERKADLQLPEREWGELLLSRTAPTAGAAWTDTGDRRARR